MLDRVSTVVLGLDGSGGAQRFADYSQWDQWYSAQKSGRPSGKSSDSGDAASSGLPVAEPKAGAQAGKRKLSYIDARDYATIEDRIMEATTLLEEKQAVLELPDVVIDPVRLQASMAEVDAAQHALDTLYERWAELEAKQNA
jgi:ABC transport system ATP-binding/permease protein